MGEWESKRERLLRLLETHRLEGVLLRRASSFAWATCGANASVNTASTWAEASLLITPSRRLVLTTNIEAPRLEQEEGLAQLGWEMRVTPWHQPHDILGDLVPSGAFGADGPGLGRVDLSQEVARLRSELTPEEGMRFRQLGSLCAQAMASASGNVRPGQTEDEIAGLVARECEARGVQPIVNLIATDERVFQFRHPLPTDKRLTRYAMLVLCGRRKGLVCSLTRLIHFGRLPDSLRRKGQAVARVDASLIAATRPGSTLGQVLAQGIASYAEVGFKEEWRQHHQGGPAGYEPRECLATPDSPYVVTGGQAFAWNPSIEGTKSEDTILLDETGRHVLTEIAGWPSLPVNINGQALLRPAILEVT
jgi:antitoxin VapB